MKQTIAAILLAMMLMACTAAPTNTTNTTNTTGLVPSTDDIVLQVEYAGGFVAPDFLRTIFTVTRGGKATLETRGQNDTITSSTTRQLTDAELAQWQTATANLPTLDAEYGMELRNQVADAGYADITVNGQKTRVDPSIDEAYPAALKPLREFNNNVMSSLYDQQRLEPIQCPADSVIGGPCTLEYNPVCANGQTFGNKCGACSTEGVKEYVQGECAEKPDEGRLAFTTCEDPRPEICTKEYNPVCGEVDNGIRCIKAPCPSTDKITFATGCTACSNASVIGYWPGACDAMPSDTPTKPQGKCQAGMSSYMGQTGFVCFNSSEKEDIMKWKTCKTAATCSTGHCIYALTDSHGNEINWSGAKSGDLYTASLRCAPDDYYNYLLQTSGVNGVDDKGKFYSVIA